jgi:hypothetical protein
MPANTVKVDRTTRFGNPFSSEEYGRARAVALHRAWITGELGSGHLPTSFLQDLRARRADVIAALPSLRGKNVTIADTEPDLNKARVRIDARKWWAAKAATQVRRHAR